MAGRSERSDDFGIHDPSLSGVLMSRLDNETPEERRERILELEYYGPPALVEVKRKRRPLKGSKFNCSRGNVSFKSNSNKE